MDSDYSIVPSSITFESGDTEKNIIFAAVDDDIDDDGESVKLGFGTMPTGVSAGTTPESTVSITDGDVPSVTVSFEHGTYIVPESDDPTTTEVQENQVTVKVTLSADPERTVTIPITKAGQEGATATDYSGVPENITFDSGDTTKEFTFSATADSVDDDGESVKLTFGILPTGVSEGTTKETVVSITDDDIPTVTVNFQQATYMLNEGTSINITVTVSPDPERTVSIPLNLTNQDGATDDDHSLVPETITFNAGQLSSAFTFQADQDTDDDDGEKVKISFGSPPAGVTAGTTSETIVSITDDDVPSINVSFEQATYTVAESDSVTIKVKLNVAPERTSHHSNHQDQPGRSVKL